MNVLKNIFGRIFATWAIIIFVPTMLVFFPFIAASMLWKDPTRTKLFQQTARLWMRIFFFFHWNSINTERKEEF